MFEVCEPIAVSGDGTAILVAIDAPRVSFGALGLDGFGVYEFGVSCVEFGSLLEERLVGLRDGQVC